MRSPTAQKIQLPYWLENALQRISSLLKKPAKGGMPAMAKVAAVIVQKVHGMCLRRPPMRRMSCSPPRAWITEPAPRNSKPLKKAWVIRWKMPAENAATPQARNMYPSWEMVE